MLRKSLLLLCFLLLLVPGPIFSDNGERLTISLDNYLRLKSNNQQLLKEYEKQQQQLQTYREQYETLENLKESNIRLLNAWKQKIDSYIAIYKKAYERQQTQLSGLETQLQNIQSLLTRVESSLEKMPEYFDKLEKAHTATILKSGLISAGIGLAVGVIGFVILYFVVPMIAQPP